MVESIIIIVPQLLAIAFLTLAERKAMGRMQRRIGPNRVGYYGILQPIADAVKLILKQIVVPSKSELGIFIFSPILLFLLTLVGWIVIPFSIGIFYLDIDISIYFFMAITSLTIYGVFLSGWSANSVYPLIGGVRSSAQMISYELALSLLLLLVALVTESLNIGYMVEFQQCSWLVIPLLPVTLLCFIVCLAENNRAPYDLPEAESELVGGFLTEHSGMPFAFFFLGEYLSMILFSALQAALFFGGSLFMYFDNALIFGIKISILLFIQIWLRAAFPRYRYDQLMRLGWLSLLPLGMAFFVLISLMIN